MRLDLYLYHNGFARSRTHASNLVKLRKVKLNGVVVSKVSVEVLPETKIEVSQTDNFVSLGGIKLQKAFDAFGIDIHGKEAIDIGASNGGFTDVLLKNHAKKVYAVDVGDCALPAEFISDSRVVVKDRLNARYITFEDIGVTVDLIVVDVSFISLKLMIPPLLQFMKPNTELVALIKPQFEAGKKALTKSGILTSKKTALKVIEELSNFIIALGLCVIGVTEAPRPFPDKNQEYLIYCRKL